MVEQQLQAMQDEKVFLFASYDRHAPFVGVQPQIERGFLQRLREYRGYQKDSLALPKATPSVRNFSLVTGWPEGSAPVAPAGFEVTKYADGLDHPRWIYVADNGDVFVAESNTVLKGIMKIGAKLSRKIHTQHDGVSANRIVLFRYMMPKPGR